MRPIGLLDSAVHNRIKQPDWSNPYVTVTITVTESMCGGPYVVRCTPVVQCSIALCLLVNKYNSLSLLKTQVSNKRPVVPKIRYSDLNAKYELPENEVDKYVKKKQKIIDVIKARKKKESEIIKAHLDAEKQKVEENKDVYEFNEIGN
ncbi:monomeric archaeal dna polymerase sliding clamp [Lasius niger]|uniref:Monomeric archaeal dna polymerase sliding clamp n=1 Tax=Lasius niger TaxID=67767 RepID=A0A0J7K424_LASNI|nr:monomeric archaeal dna polymerase sliding clamp [Lasius niger]